MAGASLLGVHNWVKSQIALSNPGASPDYRLSDTSGQSITLSDVAKNPGKEVVIEVSTIQGVRTNPAASMSSIPGLEMAYPIVPRTGNHLTELMPGEIDSAMAERVVAELGLRAGLHTLNRMMISKHDQRISEPSTAALLQMGDIIKSNPSDRTPFTQRTPLIYSPERALAHWLAENADPNQVVKPEHVRAETVTKVVNASIAGKYGLATDDIKKFAEDVLTDFLLAASANRALVRELVSQNPETLKADRETIHKLLAAFPQQAHQFYNGVQRVFVAHPAFIYPAYATTLLKKSTARKIIKFVKGYPNNFKDNGEPPEVLRGIVASDRSFFTTYTGGGKIRRHLKAFLRGEYYSPTDRADDLDKSLAKQANIEVIAKHLSKDPTKIKGGFFSGKTRPLSYFSDLGGYYPAPPPKWPKPIMYAIMDTFLENIPYFLNVDSPTESKLTPVEMAYLAVPTGNLEVKVNTKKVKLSPEEVATIMAEANNIVVAAATTPPETALENSSFDAKWKEDAGTTAEAMTRLKQIIAECTKALHSATELKTTASLSFDPAGPKSILEMAYEVAETAQGKYNYNMKGDDFKFVMAILHYSVETITTRTPGRGIGNAGADFDRIVRNIVGENNQKDFNKMLKKIEKDKTLDDNFKTGLIQQAVLADLYMFYREVLTELSAPMSPDARQRTVTELKREYGEIVSMLGELSLSGSFENATRNIFRNIDEELLKAG